MRKRESSLILMLLLLALSPYFMLCFYALPYADDFCYAWSSAEPISFIGRFLHQYMGWSGRYSAHVLLCNHPLAGGRMLYYHLADLAALSAVMVALLIFFRQIISGFWTSVLTALSVLLFFLCYIPQLSDGVYWYTGVCNYELSNVCFILHISIVILLFRSKGLMRAICFIAAALLLIASIGFNEIAAAIIPTYYFFASVIFYLKRGNKEASGSAFPIILVLFFIACLAFGFLVLAPGNHVRSHQYHTHFQFFHSVLYGSLQTARFAAIWLCTIPALILSLLVISRANKLPDTALLRFDYRLILALIVFTVFMSAFMPYYTTGILGQHRTIDYAFFYFILLWMWMLISLSKKYALYDKNILSMISSRAFVALLISVVVMALTANSGRILRDCYRGTFTAYNEEFTQRQDNIRKQPSMQIPPLKDVPQSLKIVDAEVDTTCWINKAILIYTQRVEVK